MEGQQPGVDAITTALNMAAFGRSFVFDVLRSGKQDTALWYVDIRNFRSINPKFGFTVGNTILRSLVEGIRSILSHDLPVARLGADRFIFVTAEIDLKEAKEKFRKLVDHVNTAAKNAGANTRLSLTGGVYYLREFDYQKNDFQRALDYASIAHRNARNDRHSSLASFTDEDLERDTRRITIEQSIDAALEQGHIEVWYQPQIDYTYGDVIGAEALARWHHPDLGWISPAEFIPILENCGKIHDLDLHVWEEACRSAGRWRNVADGNPVPISVNVSRMEMFEPGLLDHFIELQHKYDLPKGSLHLEVTESAFVEEADRLYRIIEKMRKNNLMVEMDDFGSGLSSLNMLKDVPVDVVKLDMGFMRSAVNEDRGGVVLGSVIRMLQGLDTPIIAEGVETLEQAEMLKNMGCHLMQGFHFSRPMPLSEFEGFIASSNTIEDTRLKTKRSTQLDELLSFDASSSYLFNHAIGATLFFFAGNGTSESILVNDEFYEACGLKREDFGNAKIDPILEIDPESRRTLWRAASEAREAGAAPCRAKIRITGRWIDCIMRYLGTNSRGDVFSLNIYRSGELGSEDDIDTLQSLHDSAFAQTLLDKVMSYGFVKCSVSEGMAFDFVSHHFMTSLELSQDDFMRRFHNSFSELVVEDDRNQVVTAIWDGVRSGKIIESSFSIYHGFNQQREARLFGRVCKDADGVPWLYALILLQDLEFNGDDKDSSSLNNRIIPFDYHLKEDKLVIHYSPTGDEGEPLVVDNWLKVLDKQPERISKSSAAMVHAIVRDLRHHPTSGFTDLKCNLRGGDSLRWYHVNYSCDADDEGNTTVLHGYAQDANDQMGSAKWWRKQAEIDYLTGLLNRNAAEQAINLSMRTHGVGMMFMIDLDGFKRVNDELGHLTGDALLREVAAVLSERFRDSDVLGRYGGDEFVAFMPLHGSDAHALAERRSKDIIRTIGEIEVPDGTHAACSVGVTISRNRNSTFYDLLEAADQAMYESKMAGKGTFTIREM